MFKFKEQRLRVKRDFRVKVFIRKSAGIKGKMLTSNVKVKIKVTVKVLVGM